MMNRIRISYDTTAGLQSIVFPRQGYDPSVFGSHQLQVRDQVRPQLVHRQPDWMLAILLFCFIILAWVQVFFHKRMRQIFRAPFSQRFINQLMRDGNLFQERIAVALTAVYILSLSLFLYTFNEQVLKTYIHGISGLPLFALIIAACILLPVLKTGVIQFLGIIFRTRETTAHYMLNMLIINLITGPVLLTGLVFIIYLEYAWLLYLVLAILGFLFLLRFLRGLMVGLTLTKFSYLFLFVYLCTLEILPLLILAKLVIDRG